MFAPPVLRYLSVEPSPRAAPAGHPVSAAILSLPPSCVWLPIL
jgi:hypothetical protein